MIKKLNKERGPIKKQPWLYYFDKETDDLGRISYDAYGVDMALKDLHERLWLHSLRLRNALTYTGSGGVQDVIKKTRINRKYFITSS